MIGTRRKGFSNSVCGRKQPNLPFLLLTKERVFSMGKAARVHSVHFYDSHDSLIQRLCGVVYSGLLIGNSVLMVCTEAHRLALIQSLERLQIDVRDYARNGRFTMCDAAEMLSMFMVNGLPDAGLFMASVGQLLVGAKNSSRSKDKGLTVFGEMVAVLWERGEKNGALALEKLWNLAMEDRAFHLHCAYPEALFGEDDADLRSICELHSHVLENRPPAA
jgi:MEDS: MEthanogen/methylotroph, DcmR Sensory domain